MSTKQTRRQFLQQAATVGMTAAAFNILTRRTFGASNRPPNILLFFPDQHRPDWTSIDKDIPVRTPNLARLAQEGTRFTQAVCPSPLCAPSRACLALGREYDHTGVPTNGDNLADGIPTVYSRLRDAGYRVGGVGKFDLRKGASDWGLDGRHIVNGHRYFEEWGFTDGLDSEGKGATLIHIENRETPEKARGGAPYSKMLTDRNDGSLKRYLEWNKATKQYKISWAHTDPMDIPDDAYNDNWVGQNGLDIVKNFPTNQPWFLQVNFPGPHPPEDITFSMAEWYKDTAFPGPHANDQLPPDKHTAIRRNYSAMVENIDRWLGRYREVIEKRGELENTIIIWSSDHGEMLGNHNRWGKHIPYHQSLSVPLVASGPGIQKGRTIGGPTTTLDLTATFLDYAGATTLPEIDSKTLRPILERKTDKGRDYVTSALGNWRLVFDGRHKLIHGFDIKAASKGEQYSDEAPTTGAPPLLFDLKTDPLEDKNFAASAGDVVERLTKLMPVAKAKSA